MSDICQWVASLGYKGIQIPTWESRLIDLEKASTSKTYCDELKGKIASYGLEITELSTHLQGQLVAVNPAYDSMFDTFAPDEVKGNPTARQAWAVNYHERIRAFHVKDAEFNPTGKSGVYGGYQGWNNRAGRFRSLGDGQVDFKGIFTKLSEYGFDGWAVMEWECCVKSPEQGAREGAPFIQDHIIEVTGKAFDDFAGGAVDQNYLKGLLGI